jgi:hypothetical protein
MILRGLYLLARGAKEGMREFGDDLDSFTSSLAPLIALPLVGDGFMAAGGDWRGAGIGFLAQLCSVLSLPVIVYEFARLTKHDANWLRTVVALDWSVWVVLPAALAVGICGGLIATAGVPVESATYAAIAALLVYMLWLHLFIIRTGLGLGWGQAVALLFMCAAVQGMCAVTPMLLGFGPHGPLTG